jgi:hypothetical protein
MLINAATENAFERIAQRAADVQRAFTPGAEALFGDAGAPPSSRPSLNPLSVAPPPDAYFVTVDARGRTAYTQNGAFALRDGMLVDGEGKPVLGFTAATAASSELHCDPIDVALGRIKNARIDADGTLLYDRSAIDPRTGARENESVAVGRIALARFPAGTRVPALPGVVPHLGRPGDGNFACVEPMREENSRIDFDRSLDRLEEAYLSFDALTAAHKAQGSFGKTAMDLLK